MIKKTPLYTPLRNWVSARRQKRKLIEWEKNGKPVPPPHIIKQQTIRSFAEKYEIKILIETGTYYGDMVKALKGDFNQIYSIELSEELYEKAKQRFDGEENVRIVHGDSGVELGKLVAMIKEPVLFWLDGWSLLRRRHSQR
jgi:predicted O-methyltransferase YrrM